MADYAFRSYEERQKIQEMVEAGLPDKRLGYNAELAQLSVQQGLERRGRRSGNEA